jgi:Rieske Fe-S protein
MESKGRINLERRRVLKHIPALLVCPLLSGCNSGTPKARSARRIRIGKGERFIEPMTVLSVERLAIFRDTRGLAAISMVCTHQICLLKAAGSGFECPCHGSSFDITGKVLQGPARDDLPWYAIEREDGGELFVNTARIVPGEWRLAPV